MPTVPAVYAEPRLTVALEGLPARLPVVRFNASFGLNTIPSATVGIALGTEFRTGIPSPIHLIADALSQRRHRALVLLSLGDIIYTIFDGFTGSCGASLTNGTAQYTIQLAHWLDDLNFSSVFSKTSVPGNPADYTFGALSGADTGSTGGGPDSPTGRNWNALTYGMEHFTASNVQEDFWLKALKPWFEHLCSQDSFEAQEKNLQGAGKNSQALAALARMGDDATKDRPGCYLPLALDMTLDDDMGQVLATHATLMSGDPETLPQITIWDTLVAKFAADFMFCVVPLVSKALVVPFVPGYRTAYKTIPASEDTQVEWLGAPSRPLRGVAVLSGMEMMTSPSLGPANVDTHPLGIGGVYLPDPKAGGMFQIKRGPDWAGKLFSASQYPDESVGAAGRPIPDAQSPAVAVTPRGRAIKGRARTTKRFLDRYAQALYALEMVRGRQAVAAGPLRFDVSPGSTLLLYPSGLAPGDKLATPFYATVVQVSVHLDAEAAQAGTGFHLAHCRSPQENAGDRTSVAQHPLYKNTFSGCSLV